MKGLNNKRILLGVTGGIAAYKSADLVRRLRAANAEVRVVMTEAATAFITPLTLQALSGHPVRTQLMDPAAEAAMGHIELARWADAVLVAPATADFMARVAHGMADDLLTTLVLAADVPVALAPAMNRVMWSNAATQQNRVVLEQRGVHLFGPGTGELACGEEGEGRMLEPEELVQRLAGLFRTGALDGVRVLVSAGPTREELDPVRFISNRSSGRMGFAIAAAAAEAGAIVTLVTGPVGLDTPAQVQRVDVETTQQMFDAIVTRAPEHDIYIGAAAPADYRPRMRSVSKIKKGKSSLTLALEPAPDIVAAVAALSHAPFTVGFAAETDDLEANARAKLANKGLDMIAANWVGRPATGFEAERNALQVYWRDGSVNLAEAHKDRLARELLGVIATRYRERAAAPAGGNHAQSPG